MTAMSLRYQSARDGFRQVLPVLQSAGLVGSAEIVNRVTHVVTAIALARALTVVEFGIAAAAITVHELTRMFVQNGLGTRIVTAAEDELEEVSAAVHQLNWWLAIALAALQLTTAALVGYAFESHDLAMAIGALALVHLIYPFSMVQVFLAQRTGRWHTVSAAIAGQAVIDNMLTAGMALAGFGLWAVVLPKIFVAPLWVAWHRTATHWCPGADVCPSVRRNLLAYAVQVLGVEMLATLRGHGDKALVGLMMGPHALGLYAFASNIAHSITIGLSQCIGAVMLPFLRRGRESGRVLENFFQSLLSMMVPLVPVIILQGLLAWWYVPIVFGGKWDEAVPLLVVLSLFSVVRPVIVATSQLLRATDETFADMRLAGLSTALFFTGLTTGMWYGLVTAALFASIGLSIGAAVGLAIAIGRVRAKGAAGSTAADL